MELFYAYEADGRSCRLDALDADESGHCVRVLRHRAGDEIHVIDGLGTMYRCRLTDDSPKGAEAEVLEAFPGWGGHPYRLTVACCPTKNNDRFEWFVEKATEVGVDRIVPTIGERSERKVYKTDRALRIALSATKAHRLLLRRRYQAHLHSGSFESLRRQGHHHPDRPGRGFLPGGSTPGRGTWLHSRPPRSLPPPYRNRRGPGGHGGLPVILGIQLLHRVMTGAEPGTQPLPGRVSGA